MDGETMRAGELQPAARFQADLQRGGREEVVLDTFFSRWYTVEPVSMAWQQGGVDRVFVEKKSHIRHTVEYKSDTKAGETGNCFIETVSVDTINKAGWAFSSLAQRLIYYVPPKKMLYVVPMCALKESLQEWGKKFTVKSKLNENRAGDGYYYTKGVIVPLVELALLGKTLFCTIFNGKLVRIEDFGGVEEMMPEHNAPIKWQPLSLQNYGKQEQTKMIF